MGTLSASLRIANYQKYTKIKKTSNNTFYGGMCYVDVTKVHCKKCLSAHCGACGGTRAWLSALKWQDSFVMVNHWPQYNAVTVAHPFFTALVHIWKPGRACFPSSVYIR